jgi:hypothetical protein
LNSIIEVVLIQHWQWFVRCSSVSAVKWKRSGSKKRVEKKD